MLLILASIVVGLALCLYLSCTWHAGYWEKRNVPTIKPSFGFGNLKEAFFMTKHLCDVYTEIYKKFDGYLYGGIYKMRHPALFIRDPEIIRDILVKDFNNFQNNDTYIDPKVDPYGSKNPFFSTGAQWRTTRTFLSPMFTSGRLKAMFPLMLDVADKLVDYLKAEPDATNGNGMESKELSAKYTTDVTALCGFGIEAKSFTSTNPELREMGRKILDGGVWSTFKFLISTVFRELHSILRIKFFSTEVVHFFKNIIVEAMAYREKNNLSRNDVLDYMTNLKSKTPGFTIDDITAHCLSFYIEGFETSSAALSLLLYDLAENPDVCDRLRDEIEQVIAENDGVVNYDAVQKMKYLECVLFETFRRHPFGAGMSKVCTGKTTIPHHKGREAGPPLEIDVGMTVIIPIYPLQHDEKYFPNPSKFDPDRFSEERKDDIVRFTYLPFSEGPRQCLGTRYAYEQIKAAIVALVRNFDMSINKRTKLPIEIDPTKLLALPKGGIWLDFRLRKKNV